MTTSDKKKIVLLVLLVAVGASLYVWLYRSTGAKPAEARAAKAAAKGAAVKPGQDAQIADCVVRRAIQREQERHGTTNIDRSRAAPSVRPRSTFDDDAVQPLESNDRE